MEYFSASALRPERALTKKEPCRGFSGSDRWFWVLPVVVVTGIYVFVNSPSSFFQNCLQRSHFIVYKLFSKNISCHIKNVNDKCKT